MARITTNRVEMKRRRELMDAAMVRARATRLAHEAAAAVRRKVQPKDNDIKPMSVPESKVDAWIREHGDANNMTLLPRDERNSGGNRVYVVRCGTCQMDIRVTTMTKLQIHVESAAHVSTLQTGRAPETKVDAWIREHGDANNMTLLSRDERTSSGARVHVVRCGTCSTDIRVTTMANLQIHLDSAAHVSKLQSGRAPETKVVAFIREHGDANNMTLLSSDERTNCVRGRWVVRCGACNVDLSADSAHQLLLHTGCGRHIAALAPKSERPPLRKRPRC
jgi:hypothetical protein